MKRRLLLSPVLLLCLVVLSSGQSAGAPPDPDAVVVDPEDFRPPVPDPQFGLAQKYNGKVVRFSGTISKVYTDKLTRKDSYELSHDISVLVRLKAKESPKVMGKETVAVAVYFRHEEKELHKLAEKELKAKSPKLLPLTVQGTGQVTIDGKLVISDAVLVRGPK